MDNDNWTPFKPGQGIRAVISVAAIWGLIVIASGLIGFERTGGFDYQVTGQFGDSFGFIGALMASTAAYYAYRTYQAQSEETKILRAERREAAKLRAEPSFLNLLERRYDALKQVQYLGSEPLEGDEAISAIASAISSRLKVDSNPENVTYNFDQVMRYARNYEQYFRYVYHIVRYAERQFDGFNDDSKAITRDSLSYHYVKLLRAQLTDSELFAIAINVLTPPGSGAKRLYERYALFHNLSEGRMMLAKEVGDWDDRAFGLPH